MPTICLHKLEIAKRQLEVASAIFATGGDPISVLTLAGAAEDILGALLRRQGGKAMLGNLVELDQRITGGRTFQAVVEEVNSARNAAKHARFASEDYVALDPEGEALAMLGRALVNFARLGETLSPAMVAVQARLREV